MIMMDNKTAKKLTASVVTIILLIFCLIITTFALVYATVSLENNVFRSGYVAINLNDGNPVIGEGEFLFEPGMTVEKEFFLKNLSPCDVWFRFYFENVSGDLADILDITIKDGTTVLYNGKMSELTKANAPVAPSEELALEIDEKRILTIAFHFPENIGNEAKGAFLNFDLVADAVQTKNNENREFND